MQRKTENLEHNFLISFIEYDEFISFDLLYNFNEKIFAFDLRNKNFIIFDLKITNGKIIGFKSLSRYRIKTLSEIDSYLNSQIVDH